MVDSGAVALGDETDKEFEAIALRIHQIAATAGVLAEGRAVEAEPLSHALYLIEETLLEVEQRVERLRVAVGGADAAGPTGRES